MRGQGVIFTQRKVKDPEIDEPKTWKVRSHDNGFIFQHKSPDGSNGLVVPEDVHRQALLAFEAWGGDFGGVDVMVDRQGETFVLEINSAPSLTSPYRQECFAKAFDYIVEHGKAEIPLIAAKGGYTKFIHPAINQNAR